MKENLINKLAEYEIGWWIAHHRRDEQGLIENTARLYELEFNIPYHTAVEAAKLKLQATKEYILAKRFDGNVNTQEEADKHWSKVKELLKEHFRILVEDKQNE